ncbi:MAG: MATE family efflux transporter [Angelakisella sp.]
MHEKNILGEEKIGKLIIRFSIPAIIGMVVNMLYNVVDRIYIGQIPNVGGLAITGVGITMPITTIITGIGMLFGIGTSASISLALGSKDSKKAQQILNNGFVCIIFASIFVALFGNLFASNILSLFGATEKTLPFALSYLTPLLTGTIFNLIAFGLNHSISSDGSPKISMLTMIIGATINIVIDPIFIMGLNLGISGAAYATVLSQLIASCWVLFYFTKSEHSKIKLRKCYMKIDWRIIRGIVAIGMAPFAMQLAGSLVQVVSNKALLAHGGDLAIGAMAVIVSISTIYIMPIFGLNQGCQPIIGYNYGAKNYERVRKTYLLGLLWCSIILTISFAMVQLFPEMCINMFNSDAELSEIALRGLKIYLLSMPIIGIQMTASNYFQSIGKPKKAMLIGLTRQVIFLVPAFILLPLIWGLDGVWLAGPIADLLAVTFSAFVIIKELKSLGTEAR